MSFPKNPDNIILKNSFYPKGLKESQIYNYYFKNRGKILPQIIGRDLFFAIITDKGIVIKRSGKESNTKFLRITNSNYNEIITGRTISIYSTMRKYEDIFIIDIDSPDFFQGKIAAKEIYNYFSENPIKLIKNISIRYTGKTSFHIFLNLIKKNNIDDLRNFFRTILLNSPLKDKYTIEFKRNPNIPNLDLSPNKYRGGFISLNCLSIIGLKCLEVPLGDLMKFKQEDAKIF